MSVLVVAVLVVAVLVALGLTGCGTTPRATSATSAAPVPPATTAPLQAPGAATTSQLGPWHLIGHEARPGLVSDQGVTTTDSPPSVVYRGVLTIPQAVGAQGWAHVGDPDSWHGNIVDAFQGLPGATAKLFVVTSPGGTRHSYTHPLDPGELLNNSFVAVSPDGQWMVSGEFGVMDRLLVLPMPGVNPARSGADGSLARVGDILLDHRVSDVQGCDFVAATRLLCATNDPGTALWPTDRQLLEVDLTGGLNGRPTTAHVSDLGALPQQSTCAGTFETEGIDYDPGTAVLRVEVVPPAPCDEVTTVYQYRTA
ncbi:MAG: hypothetical protein M3137_16900 [Actinomycetota bacterium]|nr:hypothetical protein [Actinomycetota bacterium]